MILFMNKCDKDLSEGRGLDNLGLVRVQLPEGGSARIGGDDVEGENVDGQAGEVGRLRHRDARGCRSCYSRVANCELRMAKRN